MSQFSQSNPAAGQVQGQIQSQIQVQGTSPASTGQMQQGTQNAPAGNTPRISLKDWASI